MSDRTKLYILLCFVGLLFASGCGAGPAQADEKPVEESSTPSADPSKCNCGEADWDGLPPGGKAREAAPAPTPAPQP